MESMGFPKLIYFDTLSREEAIHQLKTVKQFNSLDCDADNQVLKKRLKMYERTRHLVFWHDGSSLSRVVCNRENQDSLFTYKLCTF